MARFNHNVEPYFDDFDKSKNYLKVMYRPGRPVQARELNQTQSILQNQIESFGNHIFKNGSRVSNAASSIQSKDYVRLLGDLDVEQFPVGTQLVGVTSGVKATLVKAVNVEDTDPATLYVVYTGTAIDGSTSKFIPGEVIQFLDENSFVVFEATIRCPSCPGSGLSDTIAPLGRGQLFTISAGIFYFEGMFLNVNQQDLIVSKYLVTDNDGNITNFVPCKVGLDFVQSYVSWEEDNSLLDPSLGYPNSTAPGADRYKVELILAKRAYDFDDGENFITVARFGEGMILEFLKTDSEYADIMDTLAKRTFETNGDYTVRPFKLSFLNAQKSSSTDPLGYSLSGDPDKLMALVTPSVAYVKGYRVETISDTPIQFDKARDDKHLTGFTKHFSGRTYVLGNPLTGVWPNPAAQAAMLGGATVQIYDGYPTSSAATGSVIGSFKVSDVEYVSGTIGSTAVFRYYIYDLTINTSHTFSQAKGFVVTGQSFYTKSVNDPITTVPELYNANQTALIYRLDRDNIKTLRDEFDAGTMTVVVRKKLAITATSGTVDFTSVMAGGAFDSPISLVAWKVNGSTVTPLNPATASFSPTDIVFNSGIVSGDNVYLIANVILTAQEEKTKTFANQIVQTTVMPGAAINDIVLLGKVDVVRINSIHLYDTSAPSVTIEDMTNQYRLDNGITDVAYTESKLIRTKVGSTTILSTHRLAIDLDYLAHTGNEGYFTIDSYSTVISNTSSGITYETLPVYTASTGVKYPVGSSIDFRPDIIGSTNNSLLPANESTAVFDVSYYLSRADLLQINKDGALYMKKGTPSDTPYLPRPDADAMALYEVWLTPYTYTLKDVSTRYIDNRRYTMRDIGALEKRIENVEYITVLNVVEKSAADMAIKDVNGLDRFKNGFIADDFRDFQAADLANSEFRAAADRNKRQLRPQFKASSRKLKYNAAASSGVQLLGNVAVRPFTEVVEITQPYATKHLSVNPYLQYNQLGQMVLSPNNDFWADETLVPQVITDVDSGLTPINNLTENTTQTTTTTTLLASTDWGSWTNWNHTIVGAPLYVRGNDLIAYQNAFGIVRDGISVNTRQRQTTVTTTTTTPGVATTVDSRTDTHNGDTALKDVRLIPYVRETTVEFTVTKLKPNTRVYAFFDGQAVSEFCRNTSTQITTGNLSQTAQLVAYGSPLITDSNGEIGGEFKIPGGRFFVGDRKFVLTDDSTLSGDPDVQTTYAEAVFHAGGIDITKSVTTVQNPPTPTSPPVTDVTDPTPEVIPPTPVTTPTPNPVPRTCFQPEDIQRQAMWNRRCACTTGRSWLCSDPIAQAFTVTTDMFISGFDLFFKSVDLVSDRIFVEVRNMVNGYPGTQRIAVRNFLPAQIAPYVSDTGQTAFKVLFDVPVFVQSNNDYCVVIGGASPNTRVWVAHLGQEDVFIPGKIVETPALSGVSFRSLNGTTWNAEQFEQIKFNLYRAKFTAGTMNVVFNNDSTADDFDLIENPLQFEAGSNNVRVYHPNHGLVPLDNVKLSLTDGAVFNVLAASMPPQVGQYFHTSTGSGTLTSVTPTMVTNEYAITVKHMAGVFTTGQSYTCDSLTKFVRDPFVLTTLGSSRSSSIILTSSTGTVSQNSYDTRFPSGLVSGVPLSELIATKQVFAVDSQDTFIIQTTTAANTTGRFGGTGLKVAQGNVKYDVFNVAGVYAPYRSTEAWTMVGIGHGDPWSVFTSVNYNTMPALPFKPQEDRFLGQPYKIAGALNETNNLAPGDKSITVTGSFTTDSDYTSPVINLDAFSISVIGNRAEWMDKTAMDQHPTGSTFWVAEETNVGGSETYKYVTRTVNLANPAEDLHIFLDVYKDLYADFDIFVKVKPIYATGTIDDQPWLKATVDKSRSSFDLTDFIEYEVIASQHVTSYIDHAVTYPAWAAEPFSSLKVKLVGRTKNSAKPPLFRSLRIIAVT